MKRATFARGFIAMERYHGAMLKNYRYAFYNRVGDGYTISDYKLDYDKSRWIGGLSADVIKAPAMKEYSVKFSAYGRITDATYESDLNILIYALNPDCETMYLIGYTGEKSKKLDEHIKLGFHQFAIDNGFDPVAYNNENVNYTPLNTPGFFDRYIKGRYASSIFNRGGHYVKIHNPGTKKPSVVIDANMSDFGYFELGKTLLITPGKHRWVKQGLQDYTPLSENELIYLVLPNYKNKAVLVAQNDAFTRQEEMEVFRYLYECVSVKHIVLHGSGVPGSKTPYSTIDIYEKRNNLSTYAIDIYFRTFTKIADMPYSMTIELCESESPLDAASRIIENMDLYKIAYAGDMKYPL